MLTDPLLVAHLAGGNLKAYEPLKGTVVRTRRWLLLPPQVHDELYRDPWERRPGELGGEARERRLRKHAILARFINGDMFTPNIQVKVLKPATPAFQNIIEFRSGPPSPQSRLFAMVFSPSVWIGTGLHFRDDLGDFGDLRWETACNASQQIWRELFGQRLPHPVPHPCDTKARLKVILDV